MKVGAHFDGSNPDFRASHRWYMAIIDEALMRV